MRTHSCCHQKQSTESVGTSNQLHDYVHSLGFNGQLTAAARNAWTDAIANTELEQRQYCQTTNENRFTGFVDPVFSWIATRDWSRSLER